MLNSGQSREACECSPLLDQQKSSLPHCLAWKCSIRPGSTRRLENVKQYRGYTNHTSKEPCGMPSRCIPQSQVPNTLIHQKIPNDHDHIFTRRQVLFTQQLPFKVPHGVSKDNTIAIKKKKKKKTYFHVIAVHRSHKPAESSSNQHKN